MVRYYQTKEYSGCDFVKTDILSQFSNKTSSRSPEAKKKALDMMQTLGLDPHSFYQEIEMTSPYVNTHRDVTYSPETMSLHSHTFYELLCIRTTCGAEYLVGSQRYRLQKGDIVIVPPGTSHRAILPEHMAVPYERDVIWISAEYAKMIRQFIPSLLPASEFNAYLLRTADTQMEFLCDMFHTGVLEAEEKQHGWETAVLGNTLMLVAYLQRLYIIRSILPSKAEKNELLDEIMEYIEAHFKEKILMRDIARHFYISERTVSNLFRQKLGVTFYHFLTQRRLVEAKSLILNGVLLESVGEQVGFSDYSAFYRAFKAEFGINPREFKKLEQLK